MAMPAHCSRLETLFGQELQSQCGKNRCGVQKHDGMSGSRVGECFAHEDEFERKHQAQKQAAPQASIVEGAAAFADENPDAEENRCSAESDRELHDRRCIAGDAFHRDLLKTPDHAQGDNQSCRAQIEGAAYQQCTFGIGHEVTRYGRARQFNPSRASAPQVLICNARYRPKTPGDKLPGMLSNGLRYAPVALENLDRFHSLVRDEHVRRYLMDGNLFPREWSEARVRESHCLFGRRGVGLWLVSDAATDELVGFCGFMEIASIHADPQLVYALFERSRARIRHRDGAGVDRRARAKDSRNYSPASTRLTLLRAASSKSWVSNGLRPNREISGPCSCCGSR